MPLIRPIARDALRHAIVELTHHLSESLRTAECLHDFPQSFVIHRVEGFPQIHECRVEMDVHLLTLLLQLVGDEDHIGGSATTAEAAVDFRQETLFQVVVQTVEKNVSEDFPGEVQQDDASVVVADLEVQFPARLLLDATSPGRAPSDDP
nr:unnamed protein product [Spirometra erinaceieuropaei]